MKELNIKISFEVNTFYIIRYKRTYIYEKDN